MKKYGSWLLLMSAVALAAICPSALATPLTPEKGVKYFSTELIASGNQFPWTSYWPAAFMAVNRELLDNLKMPSPPFATRYAQPGPAWKDDVYLWDTAFIAQVWKPWDVKTAEEITFAVFDHADQGRLQQAVGKDEHYKTTQPPLMAWSAWELVSWSGDKDYLARVYPVLKAYNQWLYRNRSLPGGLFFWENADESGMDNSPRFTTADLKKTVEIKKLAAVDLACYMVLDNEALAKMAEALAKTDDAAEFSKKAAALRDLINQKLYDPETGLYYDLDTATNRLLKVKSIASLFPLVAGAPDTGRAKLLRDHIMNPAEFNTPFPLPTVAKNDPTFEKDMWRGPVWINTAFLVVLGLERYGYEEEASELSFKIADGVYRNHKLSGQVYEFYDPEKDGVKELGREGSYGKIFGGGGQPKNHFVGWTGLANNLVIEHLFGFRRVGGKRLIQPRFPPAALGANVMLDLPVEGLGIELTLTPGKYQGKFHVAGFTHDFAIAPGAPLDLTF